MAKGSKKPPQGVLGDDGKTVDQAIVTSMEIRSRSVETSSEDAQQIRPYQPYENIDDKAPVGVTTTSHTSQNSVGDGIKPSFQRSNHRLCYTVLLHNPVHYDGSKPRKSSTYRRSIFYTKHQALVPMRCERSSVG